MSGTLNKGAVPLIDILLSGSLIGSQPAINLIPGAGVSIEVTEDEPVGRFDVTIGGQPGLDGADGWSPVFSIATNGERRVLQVSDWTGGSGTKPTVGKYVGTAGLVDAPADAVDVRGATGAYGNDGTDGTNGTDGADGDNGWSPIFAVVTDGERRVLQVEDWAGGTGTKPATGKYVGAAGLVDAIGDAVDIRGAAGSDAAVTPSDFQPPLVDGMIYISPGGPGGGNSFGDILSAMPIWFSSEKTWTEIGVFVGTEAGGGKCRVGIYANGGDNRPHELILDAGEIDCSVPGYRSLSISQTFASNTIYWLAAICDNGGQTLETAYLGQLFWQLGVAENDSVTSGCPTISKAMSYGALPDPYGAADSAFSPFLVGLRAGS